VTCFVDTSAFLAVLDRDDANHSEAKAVWRRLLADKRRLVTTNYVLVETIAILQLRLGMRAVQAFNDNVYPVLTIHWTDVTCHDKGMTAVLAAARKKLSFVDCVSFDAMRQRGIRQAFAFDKHFREQGFDVLASAP